MDVTNLSTPRKFLETSQFSTPGSSSSECFSHIYPFVDLQLIFAGIGGGKSSPRGSGETKTWEVISAVSQNEWVLCPGAELAFFPHGKSSFPSPNPHQLQFPVPVLTLIVFLIPWAAEVCSGFILCGAFLSIIYCRQPGSCRYYWNFWLWGSQKVKSVPCGSSVTLTKGLAVHGNNLGLIFSSCYCHKHRGKLFHWCFCLSLWKGCREGKLIFVLFQEINKWGCPWWIIQKWPPVSSPFQTCFSIPQMQRILPSLSSLINSFVLLFLVLSHLPQRLFHLITLYLLLLEGFCSSLLCSCQADLGAWGCFSVSWRFVRSHKLPELEGNCSLVTQNLEEKNHMKILREKLTNPCSALWSVGSSVQFSYRRSQDFEELRK